MLITDDMQRVIDAVCRRACRQGFILRNEIRAELAGSGMPELRWPDVVSLAGPMLTRCDGRYYYSTNSSPSERQQRRQQRLQRAVQRIIRDYRISARHERRERGRFDIVRPVEVASEDGRCVTLLSSNLSMHGIRLIGPKSLLGQKLRVCLVNDKSATSLSLIVQIVWSSVVSEGLCENGGTFLGLAPVRRASPSVAPHAT